MQRLLGGYTLIEVMLFLAISSVLLAVSIVVVQGQSGSTEFKTSMDEVSQKFQQWIDQVQNGLTGNISGSSDSSATLSCDTISISATNYPKISSAAAGAKQRGQNPNCIFMGMSVLVNNDNNNSNNIYAIPIVGLRLNSTGSISSSIQEADPIAALPNNNIGGTGVSDIDLSEAYTIPNGTRVLFSRPSSAAASCNATNPNATQCRYMAGFFTSLNSASNQTSNSQSLLAVQYPFNTSVANLSNPSIAQCIDLQSAACSTGLPVGGNLWPLVSSWQICFDSTRTDDWALLSITSNNGIGATPSVQYGKGGVACS